MRYRSSSLGNVMAVTAACILVKCVAAAPSLPNEQTVQHLVYGYIHSNGGFGTTVRKQVLRKQLESIYYFDTPDDRIRYEKGAASVTIPGLEVGPRFFDDDGIPYPAWYKLFRPENILVVPPPAGLSDDVAQMAVVFIPDWSSGDKHYYNGPGMFRLVHIGEKWLMRFDTYKPTPRESQDDSDVYTVLQEQGVRAKRTKWANASGDDLQLLRRRYQDDARYVIAGNQYALTHKIGFANPNDRAHYITKERIAAQLENFNKMSNMPINDFRKYVLSEYDSVLEIFAENRKKDEQGNAYMKQQDLKRQHP